MKFLNLINTETGEPFFEFGTGFLRKFLMGDDLKPVSVTNTRPNNTDAYTAKDAIGPTPAAVLTFANVVDVNGGSGKIFSAIIKKTNVSITLASFRLHLYTTAPTAVADNAQWASLAANPDPIGFIDFIFGANDQGGTGSDKIVLMASNLNLDFKCAADSKNLYGVETALDAYVPAANEAHTITLNVGRN